MPGIERLAPAPMHSLLGDWVPPLHDPVNHPSDPGDEPPPPRSAPPTAALTQQLMLPRTPSAPVVEPVAPTPPASPASIDLFDAKARIYGREIPLSPEAHAAITQLVLQALEADDAIQRASLAAALLPAGGQLAMPAPGEPGPSVVP